MAVMERREVPLDGPDLPELIRAVLERDACFRFAARGWSMGPFIRDGDVITVAPLPEPLPGVGEVVAFVRPVPGNLVVHRVVAVRGETRLIRGDSLTGPGYEWVEPAHLLGRVIRVERNGRRIWLGLGPERYLIAAFSRLGWLAPLTRRIARWIKPLRRC